MLVPKVIFIAMVLKPELVQEDEVWEKFKNAAMEELPRKRLVVNVIEEKKRGQIVVWLM